MYLWGEAGWSSSLNQDNLRSGSREQICLYFKAAPLFVMIRFPKYTNVDLFGEPASENDHFFSNGKLIACNISFWNKKTFLAFYW